MAKKVASDIELKALRSWMNAAFYQTWDLDEEGGMLGVVDREFGHSPEAAQEVVQYIDKLVQLISELPEVTECLVNFTGDYDPSYDNMTTIEWLVRLKAYLQGDKSAFENADTQSP